MKNQITFLFSLIILLILILSCATGDINSTAFWVQSIFLVCIFGLLTGAIAKSKGHSFGAWFVFGAGLFIVAFPMVLFLEKTADNVTTKKCPQCAEVIQKEALVCRYCQYKFTVENLSDPKSNDNLVIENNYFCQKCGEELFLDEDELKNKKFTCPKCNFTQIIP